MRRWKIAAASVAVSALVAIPTAAFVIIPAFARSTLYEAPLPSSSPLPLASAPVGPTAPASTQAPRRVGDLTRIDFVHYGSGRVTLAGGVLRFENVDIAGAPNMYVYLSDRIDGQPGKFVDLGPLKATNGSFNYKVPPGTTRSSIRSVVVWCRAFSVTVTFAVLS